MDCSLPGSSVHGILQARILDWVAISFSNYFSWLEANTPWKKSVLYSREFEVLVSKSYLLPFAPWNFEHIPDESSYLHVSQSALGQVDKSSSFWGDGLSHTSWKTKFSPKSLSFETFSFLWTKKFKRRNSEQKDWASVNKGGIMFRFINCLKFVF